MVRPPTTTYNNSATNAYYDPYTKSIRYTVDYSKSNHADGVVVGGGALVGRIVDILPVECHELFFDMPGRVLMGEIMEIVDADEVETKKEVHPIVEAPYQQLHHLPPLPDITKPQQQQQPPPTTTTTTITLSALLQKSHTLLQNHKHQSQTLLKSHQLARRSFLNTTASSTLDDREEILYELEKSQEREWEELWERQEREAGDLFGEVLSDGGLVVVKEVVRVVEKSDGQDVKQQQYQQREEGTEKPQDQLIEQHDALTPSTAVSVSKAPVVEPIDDGLVDSATAPPPSTGIPNNNTSEEKEEEQLRRRKQQQPLDKATLDKQKAQDIKTLMRNRSLGREERQKQMAEIKERYNASLALLEGKDGGNARPIVVNTTNNNSNGNHELQAVMKDRSLSREEKQKKLTEVKEKYAAMKDGEEGDERPTVPNVAATSSASSRWNRVAVASDRRTDGPKQDDESDESSEAASMASSKSAGSNASRSSQEKVTNAASRWNKAAIKAVTSSYVAGSIASSHPSNSSFSVVETEDEVEEKIESPRSPSTADRWNRASVKAATFGMISNSGGELNAESEEEEEYEEALKPATVLEPISDLNDESNRSASVEFSEDMKMEIKAVMRNRALSRDERQRRVQEIKDRYASEEAAAGDNDEEQSQGDTSASSVARAASATPVSSVARSTSVTPTPSGTQFPDAAASSTDETSSQTRHVTISEPSSQNNSIRSSKPVPDPLESAEVNKTPIKKLIKKLEDSDESITVLKLDGRGKIKSSDWESLFEALEVNNTLTHLSMVKCGLTDEVAVGLVLALVENETLVSLKLATNRGLTEDTGKGFVKVLGQSNSTLKKLDLARTRVSKKSLEKIQEILDERDEEKIKLKMQEERQNKIKALLAVSASDEVQKRRISEQLSERDSDDDLGNDDELGGTLHSKKSHKTNLSMKSQKSSRSLMSAGSSKKSLGSKKSKSRSKSHRLSESDNSLKSSGTGKGGGGAGRGRGGRRAGPGGRGGRGGGNPSLRASVTARQMATLGGDIISGVGADAKSMREQRKMKGECEDCGQKCFEKRMFKSTPLTIPNVVHEGRCLKCHPM
ncbi:predicted protein [Thalassiosira pseudonana CCMP1335]|uniref:Uncharacterized protein n=1 Tax=Thalassiosira pseudonana TaxID=35128 RepID=B8C3V8_THAPS|nr:predicted protein [Thalassiosira pseudonana CCMP1335]EED92627.1 predicted protein [Thalassiosira pseudonana CCMP1335]